MSDEHWIAEDFSARERPVALLAVTLAVVFMTALAVIFMGPALPISVYEAIVYVPSLPEVFTNLDVALAI